MKNKCVDLRNHLFEVIEALKDGSMEIDRAKAIVECANAVVNTAKEETRFLAVTGAKPDLDFFDKPALPAPKRPEQ